uniref:Uncharacterized protein n=1 Tax=Arundo donax TaxID=35708 RepID=A0A0A9AQ25_ARUDO
MSLTPAPEKNSKEQNTLTNFTVMGIQNLPLTLPILREYVHQQ